MMEQDILLSEVKNIVSLIENENKSSTERRIEYNQKLISFRDKLSDYVNKFEGVIKEIDIVLKEEDKDSCCRNFIKTLLYSTILPIGVLLLTEIIFLIVKSI